MTVTKHTGVILIVLTLSFWKVNSEIIERPRNTLALSGQRTILRCCSHNRNANIKWTKYSHILPMKICDRGYCPEENYEIDNHTQGCNDLVVVSASANDAALYECKIDGGSSVAAHLVIYSCRTNISNSHDLVEGDYVVFRCEIMWKDKSQFQVYWKDAYGNILNWTNFTEQQDAYVSTLTVSLLRPELHGFSWFLQFLATPVTDNIDMSTPVANWTCKRMNVSYPVSSVRTSCRDNACEKKVGDLITCFADGYPSPDYLWLDEDDKQISRNPELILQSEDSQNYRCVATNLIRGHSHTASVSVKVFIREENVGSSLATVIYYIAFIVTLIFFFLFGRKILKDKTKITNLLVFCRKERGVTKHGTEETHELIQSNQPLTSDNEGNVNDNVQPLTSDNNGNGDDNVDNDDDENDSDEDDEDEDDEDQNDDEDEKETILPKGKDEHEDDGNLKISEQIADSDNDYV